MVNLEFNHLLLVKITFPEISLKSVQNNFSSELTFNLFYHLLVKLMA